MSWLFNAKSFLVVFLVLNCNHAYQTKALTRGYISQYSKKATSRLFLKRNSSETSLQHLKPARTIQLSVVPLLFACFQLAFPSPSYAGIDALDGAFNAMNSKSYSNNVRNFERMAQGDYSMGSKDISTSERAQKRRAMTGCKKTEVLHNLGDITEKSCSVSVMADDLKMIADINTILKKKE